MSLQNGKVLKGEHAIAEYLLVSKFGTKEAHLTPLAPLNPKAQQAIREADLIIIGPGNLYSSLVPNLLVKGLPEALLRARAPKVFVANLMNKHGHTDDFTCERYVEELERMAGKHCISTVLYNTTPIPPALVRRYVDEGEPVPCVSARGGRVRYVGADLLSNTIVKPKRGDPLRRTLIRHDPDKLARAIFAYAGFVA
jgi:uncharacterized cofD-like protein